MSRDPGSRCYHHHLAYWLAYHLIAYHLAYYLVSNLLASIITAAFCTSSICVTLTYLMAYGRTPLSDAGPTRYLPSNPCNTSNGRDPTCSKRVYQLVALAAKALLAYDSGSSVLIWAIARSFGTLESTLRHRIEGRAPRSCAHEYCQILHRREE
jgi:hypothetical protein